ncbi:MAG: 1-phosphofructokinase [Lagierella massiliensis]|nr:1-phosphofructokinase [Lagierella massiliensis]
MILTVTLNPSLDYIVTVDDFKIGEINRTKMEKYLPGGKGLNVSQVLHNLGVENTALGVIGGFTGEYLVKLLNQRGINQDLIVDPKVLTRVNMKIRSNEETAINSKGSHISPKSLSSLLNKIDLLDNGDILVLAGKIPPSLPQDLYVDILKKMNAKGVKVVVDAEKEQLKLSIPEKPFLIKPNDEELGGLFSVNIKNDADVVFYAKKLQKMGAQNILISLGSKGAILLTEDNKIYKGKAPNGKLVNSVGAGDSMVAGFLYGYLMKNSMIEALKYGISSGSASAFSEDLCTKDEVMKLIDSVVIEFLED